MTAINWEFIKGRIKYMKHRGTQKLETERLILRRFVCEDDSAMYKNWASDDEVTKYLTWSAHANIDASKVVLEDWINSYSNEKYYQWAIVLKENGDEPIGSISVVHMNEDVSMVEIGYCIGRSWWHQGITSEAMKAVIDFFFEEVGVNRIESRHDPRNPNSGKVMQKCGMKYEGTLRSSDRSNQGICDACYYGLLKSDRNSNSSIPVDSSSLAIHFLNDEDKPVTQEAVEKLARQIQKNQISSACLALDEYGEEDFFYVEMAHGWASLSFHTWDEKGESHMYQPVNSQYDVSLEEAPVLIGGHTPVLKRNALDDLGLAAECVVYFAKTGKLYPDLKWEEAR